MTATPRPQSAHRSIVLVGRLSPENPIPHFASAFRERGWLVSEIDETQTYALAHSLPGMTLSRLLSRHFEGELQASILARAQSVGAAAVLVAKGSHILPRTVRELRQRGIRTINWYPDFDFAYAGYDEARLCDYDLIITSKRHQVAHIRTNYPGVLCEFVEHGYCPGLHRPMLSAEREFDAIYVGNESSHKRRILVEVANLLPHRRFAVAGARWQGDLPSNIARLGVQTGDFMALALGRAHCAMAFHMGAHGPYGWEDLVSARTFEIPACGVPMLHIDNPEVRGWFAAETEFLPFADAASLADGIEVFRNAPERAEKMARAAFARAVPHYGYDRRGAEVAQHIEAARWTP